METNKHYNVNIYYSEEEVLAAFTNYYDDLKQNSKIHVFTKDTAPLSHYMADQNVELHHSGGFFDKIRSWLSGDEQFDDQFAHLNITPEEREKYRDIIENGGTIIVSSVDANQNPTFNSNAVAHRNKFADDFNDPISSAAFGGTTSLTNKEKFANNAITDPEDPMFQALNSESDEFVKSGSETSHKSFPYTPDTNDEDQAFKPVPQDEAANDSKNALDVTDLHQENNNPEKKSFPYMPNEAIENDGSVLSHPAADNNESRNEHLADNHQNETLFEPMPENIVFNPVQDISEDNEKYNQNETSLKNENENLNLSSDKPVEDIPFSFQDGHPNTSTVDEELTDSHNQPMKQEIAPDETTSTFETISSRNSDNTTKMNDEFDQLGTMDTNIHNSSEKSFEQNNDYEDRLAPDDTLHRPDGLEDEETYQDSPENDESYSNLRDETIGKAADYRRHDLP